MNVIANLSIFTKSYTPEELNKIIGINADKIMHCGEARSKGSSMKWEENVWVITSTKKESNILSEHIRELLDRIKPFSDKLLKLQNCEIQFDCIIEGDENPELSFSNDLMRDISNLNASLDIDMYVAGD